MNKLPIFVIKVLYFPDENQIEKNVNILFHEVSEIILVDNTPNCRNIFLEQLALNIPNVTYLPLRKNMGIAQAQNVGIKKGLQFKNVTHFLFLDQDTSLEENFASSMFNQYRLLSEKEVNISVLAPTLFNKQLNQIYKRKVVKDFGEYYYTDKVSSSGSIISKEVFSNVGLFESSLFIDLVDSEWCWRSNSYGFKCCITRTISINHPIGERNIKFLGYHIILSSRIRYYYQYRNWIIMLTRSYVPLEWKVKSSIKSLFYMFIIPFLRKDGIRCIKNMFKGIFHSFFYKKAI